MKNTVFTVIAVLLLLTTAQFAAGQDRIFTIRNQSAEPAWVSYAYKVSSGGFLGFLDFDYVAKGYNKVEGGGSILQLQFPNGVGFLRIEQNGETIIPGNTETNLPFFDNHTSSFWQHPTKDHAIYQTSILKRVLPHSSPRDGLERAEYRGFQSQVDDTQTHHELVYNIGGTNRAPIAVTAVTIDGLSIPPGRSLPNKGGNAFITLEQMGNTCGPTSLEMVLHYYKKWATMEEIWNAGDIHTVLIGTFPGEMKKALNGLGVPAAWYDWGDDPFGRLRTYVDENRPPCILLRYKASEYHWVVVVGYNTPTDEYLIADPADRPNGAFRWISGEQLDAAWGFKTDVDATIWYGGFDVLGGGWLDAVVSFKAEPYTRIVPRSAPTGHFVGLWSETEAIRVTGSKRFLGRTRGWEETIKLDNKFKYYKAAGIEEIDSFGTARLDGAEKVGTKSLKLWGRIEDGWVLRGRMSVLVRTYRTEESPAAPAQIVPTRLSASTAETSLLPNYPNPFNPETWIPYQLAKPAEVNVSIYSADGKLVRRLDLGQMPSGVYRSRARAAYWNGRNAQGEPVASGVYFYTLTAGEFSATRKMVIRK